MKSFLSSTSFSPSWRWSEVSNGGDVPPRKPKRVSFHQRVRVRLHIHLNEMSEGEITDCFYQPHEYDGMVDDYIRMVELMENQPRQHQISNSKGPTFWCTSCISDVVPIDDAALVVGTGRSTENTADIKQKRVMNVKTLRRQFGRDGFGCRLSPKGVRFLVYGRGEKDATLASTLTSSCGPFCSCFRGLETRQRQADKVAIRKRACRAVLTEQLKSTTVAQVPLHGSSMSPSGSQYVRHYDFNAIALAYKVRGKTTICQRRAHAVALDDALSALLSDTSHATMNVAAAFAA